MVLNFNKINKNKQIQPTYAIYRQMSEQKKCYFVANEVNRNLFYVYINIKGIYLIYNYDCRHHPKHSNICLQIYLLKRPSNQVNIPPWFESPVGNCRKKQQIYLQTKIFELQQQLRLIF